MRSFAVIALIGAISAVKLEHHKSTMYRPNPTLSPWAAKPADAPPATKITGAFNPTEKWQIYDRKVPDLYTAPGDDKLMESLIKTYAVEGNKEGVPNGQFYMTRTGLDAAAKEVIGTHLGMKGAELDSYAAAHVPKLWQHFDVLNEGFLDIAKVPSLLKMLVGEVNANGGLMMQIATYASPDQHKWSIRETEPGPTNTCVNPVEIEHPPMPDGVNPCSFVQTSDNESDPAFLAGKAVAANVVATQQAFEAKKTADVATRNDKDSKECLDLRTQVVTTHETRLQSFDPNVQMVYIPEQEIYLGLYKKDDINYDAHFDAGKSASVTSYSNDKAARDAAVGAQAASDAWRGVKDPSIFALR